MDHALDLDTTQVHDLDLALVTDIFRRVLICLSNKTNWL